MLGYTQKYVQTLTTVNEVFASLFADVEYFTDYGQLPNRPEAKPVPLIFGQEDYYIARKQYDGDMKHDMSITMPRMVYTEGGLSFDAERMNNKYRYDYNGSGQLTVMPIPYKKHFMLDIVARTFHQHNHILEQILPRFTPTLQVPVEHNHTSPPIEENIIFQLDTTETVPNYETENGDTDFRVTTRLDFIVSFYTWDFNDDTDSVRSVIQKPLVIDEPDQEAYPIKLGEAYFTNLKYKYNGEVKASIKDGKSLTEQTWKSDFIPWEPYMHLESSPVLIGETVRGVGDIDVWQDNDDRWKTVKLEQNKLYTYDGTNKRWEQATQSFTTKSDFVREWNKI